MKRSNPSLPESVSTDPRPLPVAKTETPLWNSGTTTPFSASPVRSVFREVPSLTRPEPRSVSAPYSSSPPSLRSGPQPPPTTSMANSRPGPAVDSRPENRTGKPSAVEGLRLERPLPVQSTVSSVSAPTDRPVSVPQEKTVGAGSNPSEPYRVSGVNRTPAALPFQVSSESSVRPDAPSSVTEPGTARPVPTASAERTLPDRSKAGERPETPPFVSLSSPDRAEWTPFSSQKGGELGEYRPNGVTPPKQRAQSIGGQGMTKPLPVRSLRVSDLQ